MKYSLAIHRAIHNPLFHATVVNPDSSPVFHTYPMSSKGSEWIALGCFEGYIKNHSKVCPNAGVFRPVLTLLDREGDVPEADSRLENVSSCCLPLFYALNDLDIAPPHSAVEQTRLKAESRIKIVSFSGDERLVQPKDAASFLTSLSRDENGDDENDEPAEEEEEEEVRSTEKLMLFRAPKMSSVESCLNKGSQAGAEAYFLVYDALTNQLLGSMDRRISMGLAMVVEHCEGKIQFYGVPCGLNPRFEDRKNQSRVSVKSLTFKIATVIRRDIQLEGEEYSVRDIFCRPRKYFLRRGIKWLKRQFSRIRTNSAKTGTQEDLGENAEVMLDHLLLMSTLPSDDCSLKQCKHKHCKTNLLKRKHSEGSSSSGSGSGNSQTPQKRLKHVKHVENESSVHP